MGLNQFAKISPVVNSSGVLLEKKEDGSYTTSGVKLKNNETGICIEDNSIIVMFNGSPLKLTGGLFKNMSSAQAYCENNEDGQYNGQLVVIKSDPTNVYVIAGNQLYNLTENATKTIVVELPQSPETEMFSIIENSIMQDQDEYSKEYLINTIDVKVSGDLTSFVDSNHMHDIKYPTICIKGSLKGNTNINITDSFNNNITRITVDDIFKGKLGISMKVLEGNECDHNAIGSDVISYSGATITLIITYTTGILKY